LATNIPSNLKYDRSITSLIGPPPRFYLDTDEISELAVLAAVLTNTTRLSKKEEKKEDIIGSLCGEFALSKSNRLVVSYPSNGINERIGARQLFNRFLSTEEIILDDSGRFSLSQKGIVRMRGYLNRAGLTEHIAWGEQVNYEGDMIDSSPGIGPSRNSQLSLPFKLSFYRDLLEEHPV
jgi:hypothetical protein